MGASTLITARRIIMKKYKFDECGNAFRFNPITKRYEFVGILIRSNEKEFIKRYERAHY
jgi:hypothetical protein